MSDIPAKVKEGLALLYEHPEFKNLEKWSEIKKLESMNAILGINMQDLRAETRVAFLQGQAYAHEYMMKELRKIHKDTTPKD